jgi:uncharacterized protein with HEPN domain
VCSIRGSFLLYIFHEAGCAYSMAQWRMIWSGCIMRNRLVHAYFDINSDILWKTVIEGLPPIIEELKKAVDEQNKLL